MAETAYGSSNDLAYPPVELPSLGPEEQPNQPLQITISKPSPPLTLQPVEHQPEFETPLKLIPVDHHPEFIDDTGRNAQEAPETLALQQRDLLNGRRPVQMFPAGTEGLPLPAGMHEARNERGTFHYDPTKISEAEILDLSGQGRENEFLGLGPVSKPEVEHRVARGEQPVAITEYTPDGVEVRSAAGTDKTAHAQKQFFEQTKQPGNIVAVGPAPSRVPPADQLAPSFGFQPTPEQNAMAKRFLDAMNYLFLGAPANDASGKPLPPSYGLPGQLIDMVAEPGRIATSGVREMPQTGTWSDTDEAMRQVELGELANRKADYGTNVGLQLMGTSLPFVKPSPTTIGLFGGPLAKGVREGGPLKEDFYRATAMDATYGSPDYLLEMSKETGKTVPALIGELRDRIWDETGWFKGVDGKWRHEIPDIGAKLKDVNGQPYPIDKPHETTVGEALDHPELFKQYPGLKNSKLTFEKDTGQPYIAQRNGYGSIGIVAKKEVTPESLKEVLLSLLHELQHNLQGHEGFSGGGSPLDKKLRPKARAALKSKTPAALARISEIEGDIKDWAINNPDRNPLDFFDRFPNTAIEYSDLLDTINGNNRALARELIDMYERMAGEAEANNVANRAGLDEQMRKMAHPDYTSPHPPEKQVLTNPAPKMMLRDYDEAGNPRDKWYQARPQGEAAPPFYSAVARAIDDIPQEKAPPAQWAGMLRNKPGVKPEELKWLGLDDWLREQKGPVTKQQISDFVKANQIEVKEVTKGGRDLENDPEYQRLEAENRRLSQEYNRDNTSTERREEIARAMTQNQGRQGDMIRASEPTKFHSYQLPGGENYRELLLTLPQKTHQAPTIEKGAFGQYQVTYPDGNFEGGYTLAEAQKAASEFDLNSRHSTEAPSFKSSHWDEPNVLAHIRFNDRTIDGKKTLFVEEVQSDWHQKGKREGYASDGGRHFIVENMNSGNKSEKFTTREAAQAYQQSLPQNLQDATIIRERLSPKAPHAVPDAPFKTTWPELAMKRMIKYAADNGYDKVAWTPGDVQAARYDLSKHVDEVQYFPDSDYLTFKNKGGGWDDVSDVPKEKLADHIGKDAAEKLLNTETEEFRGESRRLGILDGEPFHALKGLDLKVGGEGMKGFYDQILPATVNKLVKKFGGKVEQKALDGRGPPGRELTGEVMRQQGDINHWKVQWNDGSYSGGYGSREAAEAARESRLSQRKKNMSEVTPTVHTVDITPQMQTAVREQGMPMFKAKKPEPELPQGEAFSKSAALGHPFPDLAEKYPDVPPPVMKTDKKKGTQYLGKGDPPAELQKFRSLVQEDINAGRYDPYFDVEKRFDANPKNYPKAESTTEAAMPAKQATIEKYEKIANDPAAIKRLNTAYLAGRKHPLARGWYMMGQLEKEFVKELGPVEGRKAFAERFGRSMAATTGGSTPQSNLITSQYGNYLRQKGLPYPKESYELPFPVGGGKYGVMPNIEQHERLMGGEGISAGENPKRHNFEANFEGHADRATIDEQMSQLFQPGMTMPPTGSYGVFEAALIKAAKKAGVSPREFQEVAWAGHKALTDPSYDPHPMIQTINEAIERTHRITGMPKKEIVRRGLVRSEIPIYGLAGAIVAPAAIEAAKEQSQ